MTLSNEQETPPALFTRRKVLVLLSVAALAGCARAPKAPWLTEPWPEEYPRPTQKKVEACGNCVVPLWETENGGIKYLKDAKGEYVLRNGKRVPLVREVVMPEAIKWGADKKLTFPRILIEPPSPPDEVLNNYRPVYIADSKKDADEKIQIIQENATREMVAAAQKALSASDTPENVKSIDVSTIMENATRELERVSLLKSPSRKGSFRNLWRPHK